MTGLIIAMAVLAAVVALALARPLLRRDATPAARAEYDLTVFRDQLAEIERDAAGGLLDAEDAEAARIEVQRRMLAADAELRQGPAAPAAGGPKRLTAALVAAGVPLAAAALYLALGSPDQPNRPFAARDIAGERTRTAGADQAVDMNAIIGRLAERLLANPDDVEGWLLLGRSYASLERFEDAMNAYGRARKIADGRPDVEVAYGEALILTSGMKVTDAAAAIFQAVRDSAPFEPKARYYLGLRKAQAGDAKGALQDWADLIAISPEDAPWVPVVRQQIARAAGELDIDPATITMSEDAQALLARQPAARRPVTPIMPTAPAQPGPSREQMEAAQDMSAEERDAMIRGMVERLAERMRETPDDLAGWRRLERAYRVLGNMEKADEAAAQVRRLSN